MSVTLEQEYGVNKIYNLKVWCFIMLHLLRWQRGPLATSLTWETLAYIEI
jgi:hypothetical protein